MNRRGFFGQVFGTVVSAVIADRAKLPEVSVMTSVRLQAAL